MKKIILFFLSLIFLLNFNATFAHAGAENTVILKEIVITPTSIIAARSNNFLYKNNGENAIKVLEFSIENSSNKINLIENETYLIKNKNYSYNLQNFEFKNVNNNFQNIIYLNMINNFKFGDFQYEVKIKNEPYVLNLNKKLNSNTKNFTLHFNNINLSCGGISLKVELYFEVL